MDHRATWAVRVDDWKASGLSSEKYCEGKPFSAGGLRHWAYRLRKAKAQAPQPATSMALARVVPVKAPVARVFSAGAEPRTRAAPDRSTGVVVEIGEARVVLMAGFDRPTLAAVFEMLRQGGRGR